MKLARLMNKRLDLILKLEKLFQEKDILWYSQPSWRKFFEMKEIKDVETKLRDKEKEIRAFFKEIESYYV